MRHDVDTEVEVGRQASHDRELLVVLLSENGDVGSCGAEQFGDHGGDSVEVAGSRGALHRVGQPCNVDGRGEPVGIHRSDGWRVHDADAGGSACSQVVVERPRVPVEVAQLAELQWIDEDRHDHPVGEPARGVDQFEMAPVERPHGGHEGNRVAIGAGCIRPGAYTGRGLDQECHAGHATGACSSARGTPHGRWTHVSVGRRITDRRRREHRMGARCSEGVGGGSEDQVQSALT